MYRFDPAMLYDQLPSDEDEATDEPPGLTHKELAVLKKAEEICRDAATNQGVLGWNCGPAMKKFLRSKGVVQELPSGDTVLVHACLENGIACESPKLEQTMRSTHSTLKVEHELSAKGWNMVDKDKQASIHRRCLVRNNYSTYYDLVVHFCSNLEALEAEGWFHHKQSHGYFQAVEAAIIHQPNQLVFVPARQKAEFYSDFIKFIRGTLECDNSTSFVSVVVGRETEAIVFAGLLF